MKPKIVIGHKNPDSDSICSAICYANLKRRVTGEEYIPCRAGDVNNETKYILQRFGMPEPKLVDSLEPRIADVQFRRIEGIDAHMSLKRAWEYMSGNDIKTAPVLKDGRIRGILTLGDIARFYMEDQDATALAEANTSYRNIVDTLRGELVVGDPDGHFTEGSVVVAAANPDVLEDYIHKGDMVILGNRYESQLCAIEMNAGCIVVCLGSKVSKTIQKLARESGCSVIASPLDTYACSKLINQAVPVRHVMQTENILTVSSDDLVSDVKQSVSKRRIRYYPILDTKGDYVGMISQRNLLDIQRQQVILVDHNEKDQAVDGIRSADVIEIIDHHRIDSVETTSPIYFRNQPLGCTATIVTQMYTENGLDIEPEIAGLLCSAILSDTLMFRSPTCTPTDKRTAERLAEIAGIDITEHAMAMFKAGSTLGEKTADEIFHIDCKPFMMEGKSITAAQVTSVSQEELDGIKDKMLTYMKEFQPVSKIDMLFLMLTNIIDQSTTLLFVGNGADELVETAFNVKCGENTVFLPGVVSRKKQLIAPLSAAIKE